METKISRGNKEIVISGDACTSLIGERINPTGKKKLAAALADRNFEYIRDVAVSQVEAGADILDVNVVTPGVDEVAVLPEVVKVVMDTVDVPLCIDINDPKALKAALPIYDGKPIINSVTAEKASLEEILPLVKEYGTAVIALTIDDGGIPKEAGKRVEIAHRIVETAATLGIPKEDIIVDPLCISLGADTNAGLVTLEAIRKIKEELGINQTLGASNISFGLPGRISVNHAFLAIAIQAGITCPCVNAAHVRTAILAADLVLGRDRFAQRYIKDFRSKA